MEQITHINKLNKQTKVPSNDGTLIQFGGSDIRNGLHLFLAVNFTGDIPVTITGYRPTRQIWPRFLLCNKILERVMEGSNDRHSVTLLVHHSSHIVPYWSRTLVPDLTGSTTRSET
jgi:hypothetical protein